MGGQNGEGLHDTVMPGAWQMNKTKHRPFTRNPNQHGVVGPLPSLPFPLLPFLPIFYPLSFWGLEEDRARVSLRSNKCTSDLV